MEHTFKVTVSQHDADIALRRFIFRGTGWSTLVSVLLCILYVIYDVLSGGIGYLGVTVVMLLLLLCTVYALAFAARRKQMAELLQQLGDTPVTYHLNESEFGTESALGGSTLKWEMLKKLWMAPDLILVFYARNGYVTIPTPQIPAAALEFLADRVRASGGTVVDKLTRSGSGASPKD